jgi:hypothetical protein
MILKSFFSDNCNKTDRSILESSLNESVVHNLTTKSFYWKRKVNERWEGFGRFQFLELNWEKPFESQSTKSDIHVFWGLNNVYQFSLFKPLFFILRNIFLLGGLEMLLWQTIKRTETLPHNTHITQPYLPYLTSSHIP